MGLIGRISNGNPNGRSNGDSDDINVSDFASTNGKVDDEDVDDNVDSNVVTFNGSNDDADVNESFVIPTSTSTNFIWLT